MPGGGNMSGRLMTEPSQELRDVAGYGRAGTFEVGQWQQIALSNPYVTMAMDHLLRPVADARVDVEPVPESVIGSGPGRISQADADMHKAFVEWALTERFQLSRLSKVAAAGFLLSGFALFEPLAEETLCPAVPGRTVFALRDAQQCLPNSLDPSQPWPVDERGRLIGIRQFGPVGSGGRWVRTVLSAERALLFSWKREAGNFAGVSQLRSCWYIAGKVIPTLMKMIGVTLQKEGPGVPQAVGEKDAKDLTPAQRDELVKLYANMVAHESAGMVMPKGWKTEWAFSPVSNKGHILQVVERMGLWILQQFGAQQLVIGTGETGSRSAGETHDARSMAMVREVLGFECEVYNGARGEADGLVKRLVEWNWGPQPAYPRVKLTPQRPELAPKDLAEATKAAKDAGIFTPTLADENSFRDRAGYGPITQEDLDESRAEAAARAPQLQPGMPGQPGVHPEPDADEVDGTEPPGPEEKMPLKASVPRGPWTPWRPLTAAEQAMNLPAVDAYFTAQNATFEAQAKSITLGMLAKASPAIHAAMADGKVTPAEVAALPLDTSRLTAFLAQYAAKVRDAGKKSVHAEMAHSKPLTAAEDEQDDKGKTDAEVAVEEADEVTSAVVDATKRKMEARLRGELERESVDALRTGGDATEVVDRIVSRQIDTGAFKSDAGSVTTKVYNVGRDEAARLMGGVGSVTYTAILDNNTCEACQADDGRTAEFNSPEHDDLLPPNRDCDGGDRCRCLLIFNPGPPDGGDE